MSEENTEVDLERVITEVENEQENTPDNDEIETEQDSLQITIGDQSEDNEGDDPESNQPAPKWVKELRQNQRKLIQENRELRQKLSSTLPSEPDLKLEEKPTLESCDYEPDVFAEKLLEWNEKKRQVDQQAAQRRKAQEDAEKEWTDKLHGYNAAKQKLKLSDYDEAEYLVQETLDHTQQGIIIHGSENPAVLVYALGKNPGKAKELAAIKDPVKFTYALARLESQLKVTNRKNVPSPERVVNASGGTLAGSADKTLDRLRAEAQKTGDMSKLMAYKQQMRKVK